MSERTSRWRHRLDDVRRTWRGSPLPAFFSWWGRELRASLPSRWADGWQRSCVWYVLTCDDTGWSVRRAGAQTPPTAIDHTQTKAILSVSLQEALAGSDPQDRRLALCLAPDQVLRRALRLPKAARGDLVRVLGYEIDRQTPFRAHEVVYAAHERGLVREGHVEVALVATPKALLDPMLASLRELGVPVDAVDVLDGTERLGVNLLPQDARPRRTDPRQRLNLALAGTAIVLLGLAMHQYLHNRRGVLAAMQAQVQALQGQVRHVAALRRQLTARTDAAGFLARQRKATPTVIEVLADLTRRLPDPTWLDHLTMEASGRVSLQGESPHATALLKRVGASPYLDNPGFQGVIQTDARTGKERFYLTAQWPSPAAIPPPAHAGGARAHADAH